MPQTRQLDQKDPLELTLQIPSFAGGENTIGQDQELKVNEARLIENWDSDSLGGMIRAKGFTKIADGSSSYTNAPDCLLHHFENSAVRNFLIIEGDLLRINGSSLTVTDDNAFTSGVKTGAVSAGGKAWFTNPTDGMRFTTIGGTIDTPNDEPDTDCERMSYHKSRLVAEGGSKVVYGSRAGEGNWDSNDTWSASGDAWNMTFPDLTKGHCSGFPTGNEIAVFTEFNTYRISNIPNVAYVPVPAGHGCSAPDSIALGTEGLYFLSKYPTLGLYVWDGVNFINLTINEDWISQVNLSGRISGKYRENKYWITYNETGSGVSYPNVTRYYDARWGKWAKRPVNPLLGDNFGLLEVLTKSSNELYCTSSRTDNVYQLENTSNSDNSNETLAQYKTKDFTSLDFGLGMDEVTLKLLKAIITYYGSVGRLSMQWTSDRGLHTGSMVINLVSNGDLINSTFIVNTSFISTLPPDRTVTRPFSNSAVGRRFSFDLLNSATGDRAKIKKIKILAQVVGDCQNIQFSTPSSGQARGVKDLVHPDDQPVIIDTGEIIQTE